MSHRYYMSNGDARFVFHADHATSPEHFRPVVVIDPTDREAVERLAVAYTLVHNYSGTPWEDREQHSRDKVIDDLAAALREFAAPTLKPCTAAATVDEVVRPCELGGDHDGEHSVHHGRTRVTWGA